MVKTNFEHEIDYIRSKLRTQEVTMTLANDMEAAALRVLGFKLTRRNERYDCGNLKAYEVRK